MENDAAGIVIELKVFISPELVNADSTVFIGRRQPDDIGFKRFSYVFQKL